MILNVIPAKAGIHGSSARAAEGWVPACAGMTAFLFRVLRETTTTTALRRVFFLLVALSLAVPGWAACTGPVADQGVRLQFAAAGPEGGVGLTFLGHASFLIESPQGVKIVTDYNDLIRAPVTPDIVTMNNAHTTHYTDHIEPGVKFVLRGWDPAGGIPSRNLDYRDVKIHNVPTNVREFGSLGGTRYSGNSIFVFDVADLCLAHLGHLHHTLTAGHLADLGPIDVVMVPVDGGYTLNQTEMIEVLQQIKPKIAIPMHVFTQATLDKFLARAGEFYTVRRADDPAIVLTRASLPAVPEMLVLPGR
jgi:L-ascorbate metabolism protein UlaG (beta-lactamase superfamily)